MTNLIINYKTKIHISLNMNSTQTRNAYRKRKVCFHHNQILDFQVKTSGKRTKIEGRRNINLVSGTPTTKTTNSKCALNKKQTQSLMHSYKLVCLI